MSRISLLSALAVLVISCAGYLEEAVESPVLDGGDVTFRLKNPSARTVQLAGDWTGNNWAQGDAGAGEVLVGLMKRRDKDGVWEISIRLGPGRYRYKFLVDESRWMLDPSNPRVVRAENRGYVNLLIIP